jgi:Xaa-Pro aminopeptidase
MLIDAGGEYRGYASDITRTYAASGTFTPEQSQLYAIVRCAGLAATARCTSGTEWRDVQGGGCASNTHRRGRCNGIPSG